MLLPCKLCGLSYPKLAKAHIIPRSFYGTTTNSDDGPSRILSTKSFLRSPRSRIGEYDEKIVCAECEKYFAKLDNYAHRLLYEDTPKKIIHNNKHLVDHYDSFDQEVFRQFVLSILWRMDTTERSAFDSVKLRAFQPKVADAVKNRDSTRAPFVDAIISRFEGPNSDIIIFPTRLRIKGVNGYRICFAKHSCWFTVDQRPLPSPFMELSISKYDFLRVLRRDFRNSPELRAIEEMVQRSEHLTKKN